MLNRTLHMIIYFCTFYFNVPWQLDIGKDMNLLSDGRKVPMRTRNEKAKLVKSFSVDSKKYFCSNNSVLSLFFGAICCT